MMQGCCFFGFCFLLEGMASLQISTPEFCGSSQLGPIQPYLTASVLEGGPGIQILEAEKLFCLLNHLLIKS